MAEGFKVGRSKTLCESRMGFFDLPGDEGWQIFLISDTNRRHT